MPTHTSNDHRVTQRKLSSELEDADAILAAFIADGSIQVTCSVDRDQYSDESLEAVLDALVFAVEHPENPLSLDEVERIVGKSTEDP